VISALAMPLIDPSLRGGSIVRWVKKTGDPIAFGDEICIVGLDDFAVLRRTARATLLAGRKRKKLKSRLERRSGKVLVQVALTASDRGILGRILKEAGAPVAIGDVLGVVVSEEGEPIRSESEWLDAPRFRVVANTAEVAADEWSES